MLVTPDGQATRQLLRSDSDWNGKRKQVHMNRPALRRGSSAEVIARHVRAQIEAGQYVDGDQLPSTKALAEEWDTSVATIVRAMQLLSDEGLVINRPRSSRLVRYKPAAQSRPGADRAPTALLIGGYAGSGKSELGKIIARRTGWPILDKDTTTRPVVEAALDRLGMSPHDRESSVYLQVVRPAEYQALTSAVLENIDCGVSVVATAPFIAELRDEAWCARFQSSVANAGGELHVVWVRCDPESMHHYLRHRGAARDAGKLSDWESYLAGVDLEYTPAIEHTLVDNSLGARPLGEQADQVIGAVTKA